MSIYRKTPNFRLPRPGIRELTASVLLAVFLAAGPGPARASNLVLFDSVARVHFLEEAGGTWFYQMDLQSLDLPYHDIYLVLDGAKVVVGNPAPSLPGDVEFVSAEITSEVGVSMFASADKRAVANINNPRLLDTNEMDTYDPLLTDPLAPDTYFLSMRLGFNRQLQGNEERRIGYWAGDLRGMIDPNMPFTESDGHPIPEPATMLLGLTGLAGVLGSRRMRRRN